jgi:hypothetical protein
MTRDEVIEIAGRWVRERFGVVPPVATVSQTTPETIALVEEQIERSYTPEELEQASIGNWVVLYRCSWDTDAQGLPLRLGVRVDDRTGATKTFFED